MWSIQEFHCETGLGKKGASETATEWGVEGDEDVGPVKGSVGQ